MKNDIIHNFDNCLKDGKSAEDIIKIFKNDFIPIICSNFWLIYSDTNNHSRDGEISFSVKYDVKVRCTSSRAYCDILLETISIIETNTPGWLYTNDYDIIIYLWWLDTNKKQFKDGFIILMKKLQEWLKTTDINSFESLTTSSRCGDNEWRTENRKVPIETMLSNKLMIPIRRDYNKFLKKWFKPYSTEMLEIEKKREYKGFIA